MNEFKIGDRVVVNRNLGDSHAKRLVPGMVGTIVSAGSIACEVEFDLPFMSEFRESFTRCGVNYERLELAPEGAKGRVDLAVAAPND